MYFHLRKQDLIEKFPMLYRNENNPNPNPIFDQEWHATKNFLVTF